MERRALGARASEERKELCDITQTSSRILIVIAVGRRASAARLGGPIAPMV